MTTTPSSSNQQDREELHRTIWQIANDLRGSVDGWDFKQYVLGMLFYRFISENLTAYINEDERRGGSPDFEYADLTETHHEAKIDAPSGTALAIAQAVVAGKGGGFTSVPAEKELIAGPRGGEYEGVSVHSARMPGRVAHHELTFGGLGQTLTIRHDSISRESFMPGVTMAIRDVVSRKGLIVGLENIMGLG